jgi:zinc transport system substrate-binding protein
MEKYSKKRKKSVRVPLLFLCIFFGSFIHASDSLPKVLVSVAPYRYFVEQIAGKTVDVDLLVPEGASAHTYEPTAKQMIGSAKGVIWFRIGEPFETKALQAIKSVNPKLQVVDLREGISLIHGSCKHAHVNGHCSDDLHLWLSPKIAKIQAGLIARGLSNQFPENKPLFELNLALFLTKLDSLDRFIYETLSSVKNRTLMVSHPAYAYFCQDYQFNQLSIEFEGRDPTAKQLTKLLSDAKASGVHYILVQPQYSDKAARLIGEQIRAKLISVDPYSENYDSTLRQIATLIKENS